MDENIQASPERRILIVADAHLPLDDRDGGDESREAFRRLIEVHRSTTSTLILLGDIFDFWFEWKYAIPKYAFHILDDLRSWVDEGKAVHYFAGNHDFRIQGFLENDIGVILHMDEWVVTINGTRTWFHHGDGLAAWDVNYRRMRALFRNSTAQKLFGALVHPDLAMSIAKRTSDAGRARHRRYIDGHPPDDAYLKTAAGLIKQGYDLIVVGHTHRAKMVQISTGWYHNPGPFLVERRYSVIEAALPENKVWP